MVNLWILFPDSQIYHDMNTLKCTVKPAHAVTCIKRSHFSCPDVENFIWNESLLRGHLSYKATFSLSQRWPLNTGVTVYLLSLFVLRKWISQSNVILKTKPKIWEAMRKPLWVKQTWDMRGNEKTIVSKTNLRYERQWEDHCE